jgi:RND superfamily putative drug exporter
MHVRRFWLAGVVLAAVVALLPFSFNAERHLETATRVEGSQAETVQQELGSRFHSPFVDRVVLVVEGLPSVDSDEGSQVLATIVANLKEEPGVTAVVSYLDLRDPIFLGRKGTESAGLNRHIVGDERALQKRRSDSILASSLALLLARVIAEA